VWVAAYSHYNQSTDGENYPSYWCWCFWSRFQGDCFWIFYILFAIIVIAFDVRQ